MAVVVAGVTTPSLAREVQAEKLIAKQMRMQTRLNFNFYQTPAQKQIHLLQT
jgi:hypothetical protein